MTKTNEVKLYETTKGEEASVGEKGGVSSVVNGENLLPAPTHFSLITPKSMNVSVSVSSVDPSPFGVPVVALLHFYLILIFTCRLHS